MIVKNKLQLNLGDSFTKNDNPGSRYVVNRIEKTMLDSGVEQINSVRLKQVFPYPTETTKEHPWSPEVPNHVYVVCTVAELFENYSLNGRGRAASPRDKELAKEAKDIKDANREMLHRIDTAIRQLKAAQSADDWASRELGQESFHLDIAHLSSMLGRVSVFREYRWLAVLIHRIDKFGKNYLASMSTPSFEATEGYGFVLVTSKQWLKKIITHKLADLLEMLNAKHKFTTADFTDYVEDAFIEDPQYSIKDLTDNKHRDTSWHRWNKAMLDEHKGAFEDAQDGYYGTQSKENYHDALPSNEEVAEHVKLMKAYEESVIQKVEQEKVEKYLNSDRPVIEPVFDKDQH